MAVLSHGKSLQTKKGRQASKTCLAWWLSIWSEAIQHDGKLHAIMATPEQLAEHQDDLPLRVPVFNYSRYC